MRLRGTFLPLAVLACGLAQPAHACRVYVPQELEDIALADAVVVGRLSNYTIVRDTAFRERMLRNPDLSPDLRALYSDPAQGLLPDYARFTVEVDRALKGEVPMRITVTWDNSTFGEPASMPEGLYLIAVRDPASPAPPLRGPSATILPNPEPGTLTLLQAPCSSAFLFPLDEAPLAQVEAILRGD